MPAVDGMPMRSTSERAVDAPPPVTWDAPPRPRAPVRNASVQHTDLLKVSTHSRPSAVAGAIAGVLRQQPSVEVQAVGAGATNQAVKAIAIARGYLQDDDLDVWCMPSFLDIVIDGEARTALRLLLQRCVR